MNNKSTFKMMYIIQKGKLRPDGTAPIMARITVNGEMCHFSTRQTILPDRWLAKEYRTVGKTREEKHINTILEDLKALIKRRYTEFLTLGQVVTANKLKNSIMSLDDSSKTYLELCDLFIEDYTKLTKVRGYDNESLLRYELTRRRVAEFMASEYKISDIPLADINKRFLDRLYLWLCSEKGLANNTATKFIIAVPLCTKWRLTMAG